MTSTTISVLKNLEDELVEFFLQLHEISLIDDLVSYSVAVQVIPIQNTMDYMIKNILPLKSMVNDRNEEFFLKYDTLFAGFNEEKQDTVKKFRKFWTDLDQDNKKIIWTWFDAFIVIIQKYNSLKNGKNTEKTIIKNSA